MTNAELEERLDFLEKSHKDLSEDHRTVVDTMRGDMKGNSGMMQNLIRLMNDMYQEPNGVHPRLGRMELAIIRRDERTAGAIWAGRLVWMFVGGIIGFSGFVITVVLKLWKP